MGNHKTIECGSLSESDAVNFLIEKAAHENGFTIKMNCGLKDIYLNEQTGREVSVLLPEFLTADSALKMITAFYE